MAATGARLHGDSHGSDTGLDGDGRGSNAGLDAGTGLLVELDIHAKRVTPRPPLRAMLWLRVERGGDGVHTVEEEPEDAN